jgi:hypothetical protein
VGLLQALGRIGAEVAVRSAGQAEQGLGAVPDISRRFAKNRISITWMPEPDFLDGLMGASGVPARQAETGRDAGEAEATFSLQTPDAPRQADTAEGNF